MLKIYNTNIETNKLEEIKEFRKGSWINLVNPSENEIKRVCESINIQEDFIRDALDYEEKARIDEEEDDNTILFVIDVPVIEKSEDNDIYSTMPLGMIVVRDDFFITVSLRKNKVIRLFVNSWGADNRKVICISLFMSILKITMTLHIKCNWNIYFRAC